MAASDSLSATGGPAEPSGGFSGYAPRRLLEAVCNNASVALFIMDERQHCVYMNPAAEELTGFSLAEVQGKALHDLIHHTRPDGTPYPLEECPIDRAYPQNNQEQGEEVFVHKDGTFYTVAFTASPIREGDAVLGTIIEVRDITAQKELERHRDRVFGISQEMMVVISLDGYYQQVNSSYVQALGYTEEELLGKSGVELIHPDDIPAAMQQWQRLLRGETVHGFESRQLCKDGTYKWFAWFDAPDLEEGLIYCVANEVTEHRRRQHTLQFLSDLNEETQSLTDPDEIMAATARMLGEHLEVNRCAYAEVGEDQNSFVITGDYTRGVGSIVGSFKMEDFGVEVLRQMREGSPYVVDDSETDPRTAEYLAAYRQTEIVAAICVPLLKEGRFAACMAVHQNQARRWTEDEAELVQLVVNRCWEALERARAVRQLRESEERLRFILESMPQKIFTADAVGGGRYFNQQWNDFTGMSTEEMEDWGWTRFIHPDDVAENVRRWSHSMETGEPLQMEHRFRRADGEYHWHLTRAQPMRDASGQLVMWIGSSTDIHDFRQVQSELQESQQRFQTMADIAPVLIWLSDVDKRCFFFNRTWLEFTGRSQEEEYGDGWAEGVHPDDLDRCLDIYNSNFDARREFEMEYRLRRFDGEYRWMLDRGVPRWTGDGEFAGYIGSCIDITDMKHAKERQSFLVEAASTIASSLDYESTLRSVADMAVPALADWCAVDLLEEDGTVKRLAVQHVDPDKVRWAHEVQEQYPYDPNAPHGVPRVLATGESELYEHISDEMVVAGARDEEHLKLIRGLGFTSGMVVPLTAHGRTLGALSFVYAESGRHYSQEDLALAEDLAGRAALAISNAQLYRDAQESSRLKDEFLATMSHELRTPLTAILGWANLLSRNSLDREASTHALETIERNARAQVHLIEDLLDVSRIVTGKLHLDVQPVDLVEIVEAATDTVRPAADAKNIRLEVSVGSKPVPILGDPDRLQQVVWNLLSNALKFTPSDGHVELRLKRTDALVQITVADSGQGISPDFLPHVFDRFRQANATNTRDVGGLGLGLAIVHQLVELHGGTIRAKSPGLGQGATFTVSLPMVANGAANAGVGESGPGRDHLSDRPLPGRVALKCPAPLAGLKVLVVDDETDARELVVTVLEHCHASVRAASSVDEALAAITADPPDVLVSDIGMPGEDGYSLIKRIRALPAERGGLVPAVALTAYARAEDRMQALAAGFQMHVAKPIEPAELVAIVAGLAERGEKVE